MIYKYTNESLIKNKTNIIFFPSKWFGKKDKQFIDTFKHVTNYSKNQPVIHSKVAIKNTFHETASFHTDFNKKDELGLSIVLSSKYSSTAKFTILNDKSRKDDKCAVLINNYQSKQSQENIKINSLVLHNKYEYAQYLKNKTLDSTIDNTIRSKNIQYIYPALVSNDCHYTIDKPAPYYSSYGSPILNLHLYESLLTSVEAFQVVIPDKTSDRPSYLSPNIGLLKPYSPTCLAEIIVDSKKNGDFVNYFGKNINETTYRFSNELLELKNVYHEKTLILIYTASQNKKEIDDSFFDDFNK